MKYCTAINCMDGRVQVPVIHFLRARFDAEFVDMITDPSPCSLLAEQSRWWVLDSIYERLALSVKCHGSRGVAVVGHVRCAANDATDYEQMCQIDQAVAHVRTRQRKVEVIGLWVDENWTVSEP